MKKLTIWKIIESKSFRNGEDIFDDGDFRLTLYSLSDETYLGDLRIFGDNFINFNGLIYFEFIEEVNIFINRVLDSEDLLDDLISMINVK